MLNTVEVIWLQVHLPHLKSILVGNCYRPPSANSQYLDNMCEMLDDVCDVNREEDFLGDLNIDWLSSSCSLKKKPQTVTGACNLDQVFSQTTKVVTSSTGLKICWRKHLSPDYIFKLTATMASVTGDSSIYDVYR